VITIDEFVSGLCSIREPDFTISNVAQYVRGNPVDPDTMEPYLFFATTHYTRNLIYKCGIFELIAICWEIGQCSRIHNHQNQNCWMSVPLGRLMVQNYEIAASFGGEHFELRESGRFVMDAGHPSFVDPEMPVHAVLNLPEYEQRAASLHIYSRPFDHCLVYSLEQRTCRDVPLFYDSEYGRAAPA
jgi:cysteine dioxygenase